MRPHLDYDDVIYNRAMKVLFKKVKKELSTMLSWQLQMSSMDYSRHFKFLPFSFRGLSF